jgi:hypothetical protein
MPEEEDVCPHDHLQLVVIDGIRIFDCPDCEYEFITEGPNRSEHVRTE